MRNIFTAWHLARIATSCPHRAWHAKQPARSIGSINPMQLRPRVLASVQSERVFGLPGRGCRRNLEINFNHRRAMQLASDCFARIPVESKWFLSSLRGRSPSFSGSLSPSPLVLLRCASSLSFSRGPPPRRGHRAALACRRRLRASRCGRDEYLKPFLLAKTPERLPAPRPGSLADSEAAFASGPSFRQCIVRSSARGTGVSEAR